MKTHEIVRMKRKSLSLTQNYFADKIGVEQPAISKAEKGQAETVLNKMIAILLQDFPEDCRLIDFFPDPENKQLNRLESEMKEVKGLLYDLAKKIEGLEIQNKGT